LERISGRAYQATLELIEPIQKTDPKHKRQNATPRDHASSRAHRSIAFGADCMHE
jgi:hypothetical protein